MASTLPIIFNRRLNLLVRHVRAQNSQTFNRRMRLEEK